MWIETVLLYLSVEVSLLKTHNIKNWWFSADCTWHCQNTKELIKKNPNCVDTCSSVVVESL